MHRLDTKLTIDSYIYMVSGITLYPVGRQYGPLPKAMATPWVGPDRGVCKALGGLMPVSSVEILA